MKNSKTERDTSPAPLLRDLKLHSTVRTEIHRDMKSLANIAATEDDLAAEKRRIKSQLYLSMKRSKILRVGVEGLGAARVQLVGARSSLNEKMLRENLLSAGVSAARVNRLVEKSKMRSEGKMSVVFARERNKGGYVETQYVEDGGV